MYNGAQVITRLVANLIVDAWHNRSVSPAAGSGYDRRQFFVSLSMRFEGFAVTALR